MISQPNPFQFPQGPVPIWRGAARYDGDGLWQIGIYSVARDDAGLWSMAATGPGTLGDGYIGTYATIGDAYLRATGEPMPGFHAELGRPRPPVAHTAGPWQVVANMRGELAPFQKATGAHLLSGEGPLPRAERLANAALIGSAPDLLAALRALLPYAESRLEDMQACADELRGRSPNAVQAAAAAARARAAFHAARDAIAAATA